MIQLRVPGIWWRWWSWIVFISPWHGHCLLRRVCHPYLLLGSQPSCLLTNINITCREDIFLICKLSISRLAAKRIGTSVSLLSNALKHDPWRHPPPSGHFWEQESSQGRCGSLPFTVMQLVSPLCIVFVTVIWVGPTFRCHPPLGTPILLISVQKWRSFSIVGSFFCRIPIFVSQS